MNKKNKSLVLSGIASMFLLCGCDKTINKTEEISKTADITVDEKAEVQYSNIVMTFEPGTHIINYRDHIEYNNSNYTSTHFANNDGYLETNIPVPDGYELVNVLTVIDKYGYGSKSDSLVYVFVNNKPVEATGIYNSKKNIYEFYQPGVVVQEKVLK